MDVSETSLSLSKWVVNQHTDCTNTTHPSDPDNRDRYSLRNDGHSIFTRLISLSHYAAGWTTGESGFDYRLSQAIFSSP
jgi:hypothetical protein